jgi:hypothetical protein
MVTNKEDELSVMTYISYFRDWVPIFLTPFTFVIFLTPFTFVDIPNRWELRPERERLMRSRELPLRRSAGNCPYPTGCFHAIFEFLNFGFADCVVLSSAGGMFDTGAELMDLGGRRPRLESPPSSPLRPSTPTTAV